jgi:hypothetical protein
MNNTQAVGAATIRGQFKIGVKDPVDFVCMKGSNGKHTFEFDCGELSWVDSFVVAEAWQREKSRNEIYSRFGCTDDRAHGVIERSITKAAKNLDELISKQADGEVSEPWPEPKPLPGLSEVEQFRYDLLPESYREWIRDIVDRMQCPPDFPAVAAIITTASVIGRQICIRPRLRDDWAVVPNLWGGVVARPSLLKTPALAEPMKMLRRLEVEARKNYETAVREFAAKQLVQETSKKTRDRELLAASKNGDAEGVAARWLESEEQPPVRRRFITNDATVEKLGILHNENPNGFLNYRDELLGLLRSLDKDGQEAARAFYLEAWNGSGSFTYDRVARGTLDIDNCCLSILGGIQPGPLRDYMRDAVRGGRGDDGLLQRFQLFVWPDTTREFKNVDQWPDTKAKQQAWEIYQQLANLDPEGAGACMDVEDGEAPYLRFDRAGQTKFDDWRLALEHRLRADEESEPFLAHLGKYRSLVPSLALIFQLVDHCGGAVGVDSLDRAIAWASYLETHARRLYGGVADPQHGPAKALANRILCGDLPDGFTLRQIYQPHWSQLDTRDLATEGADVLTTLDWIRRVEVQTGGRPSINFRVNPKVIERAQERSFKRLKSTETEAFDTFETPSESSKFVFEGVNTSFDEAGVEDF